MEKLRPYQDRDYGNIVEEFKTSNHILYQAPTGSGKSIIIEKFVLDNKNKKILILAHKRELVFQMKKRLENNGIKVGIIIGNIEENLECNIIIASVRTVTLDKRIQTIINKNIDNIVIDEAHHIRTKSYENVVDSLKEKNKNLKLLGVTASPYRKDKKPLNKYFDVLICSDDIQTLQNEGYLAKYKVFYTPTKNIDEEVETAGGDYQIQSLSNYMRKPEIVQFLVDSYKKFGENKQMIVFCVDKKHAKEVKEKYEENGFKNIYHIDSDTKMDERARILSDYTQNKIQIITCIETLTEGVDLPETKCIQLGRPTQSLILFLQMVGRGSRPKADKSECILLDNAGCTLEHKMPNSPRHWSLTPEIDPSNPGKKNRIVGKRKDGTYTEDEEEMSFLELVEMTPEEYVMNIDGGIERSENLNKSYDLKCKELMIGLGKFICEKFNNPNFYFNSKDFESDYFSKTEIILKQKSNYNIEVEYNKNTKYIGLSTSGNWRCRTLSESKQVIQQKIDMGKLAQELLKDKNIKHILNIFEEIQDIEASKININELKEKARVFKQEQLKVKLSQHLITNPKITLSEEKYLGSYFRETGWSYSSNYFNQMVFSKNKLLLTNKIKFLNKDGKEISTKTSIKPEKIIEILERVSWS